MLHWKILDTKRRTLLKTIAESFNLADCYMAGGTALSLQMGLRTSVDFDFFVPHMFETDGLLFDLKQVFPDIKVLQHTSRTLDLNINNIQVSFFHYPYSMIKATTTDEELPSLHLASPEDIAAMKMSAIGSRGAKKDFFDLYHICNKLKLSPSDLYGFLQTKFGSNTDFSYMIMGLSYFEDADRESLPQTFVDTKWSEIKSFFTEYAYYMQKAAMEETGNHSSTYSPF